MIKRELRRSESSLSFSITNATSTSHNRAPVLLREVVSRDRPFIINTWVKSYAKCSIIGDKEARERNLFPEEETLTQPKGPRAPKTRAGIYLHGQHRLAKKLLKRSRSIVACHPNDIDQIFGYIVYEPGDENRQPVIHYVYVKVPFRRIGIARLMFETAKKDYGGGPAYASHWTPLVSDLVVLGLNVEYNPYRGYV